MEQRKVCENCLHWKPTGPRHETHPNLGECGMARSTDGIALTPGTLAHALDIDNREAALVTSPLFGCNQHEKAEM